MTTHPDGARFADWQQHYQDSTWFPPVTPADGLVVALADAYEASRQAVTDLLGVIIGRTRHTYEGLCTEGWGTRDPDCPACQVLARLNTNSPAT